MKKLLLVALATAMLSACAANSGVVPIGKDTYFVSRQAATGFSGMGNLKADALTEANQYCASLKKTPKILQSTQTEPPYVLGNYPKIELQFACVE